MAAGSSTRGSGGAITGINVTPLVDITLVLLVVFMVTAKVIVRRQALPVDLPKAASGEAVQEVFGLVISSDGTFQVDGQMLLDDATVVARARAAAAANRDVRVVLQADGSVPHRRVMHALDLLRQANVGKIAFGVVPPAASAATPAGGP
jgi:biopolymer transport protein ExbD